jgi:hypothetical protein
VVTRAKAHAAKESPFSEASFFIYAGQRVAGARGGQRGRVDGDSPQHDAPG